MLLNCHCLQIMEMSSWVDKARWRNYYSLRNWIKPQHFEYWSQGNMFYHSIYLIFYTLSLETHHSCRTRNIYYVHLNRYSSEQHHLDQMPRRIFCNFPCRILFLCFHIRNYHDHILNLHKNQYNCFFVSLKDF